jgi:hypothetical protein
VFCLQEFRQAAQDFDFGVPGSLVGDDRILQCVLSHVQKLQGQQQQSQAPAGTAAQSGVLLLSNDKVMQLKVSGHVTSVSASSRDLVWHCDQHQPRTRPGFSVCAQQTLPLG